MEVTALGRLTLYPAGGKYQLVVRQIEAVGEGLWRLAFERLRGLLASEGALDPDRKRRLPAVPATVGVVTSRTGAALRDVVSVVHRRAPWTRILLSDCRVQGKDAAPEIVAALDRIVRHGGSDVIVLTRGGGSVEDLWAFNEESVARAVLACPIPVVSAVGHEIDVTIADLVADFRAATPSAAGEAVVPDARELRRELEATVERLTGSLRGVVERGRRTGRDRAGQITRAMRESLSERDRAVSGASTRLDILSPLATLERGYAVPLADDGTVLRRASMFKPGSPYDLRIADAIVRSVTDEVRGLPERRE